jgi:hypothetical protein
MTILPKDVLLAVNPRGPFCRNVLDGFGEPAASIQNLDAAVEAGRPTYAAIRAIVAETRATPDVRVRQARDMAEKELTAAQAIQIAEGLAAAEVRCWVTAAGVSTPCWDEQTRAHRDVDLLVAVSDLPSLETWLREEGSPPRPPPKAKGSEAADDPGRRPSPHSRSLAIALIASLAGGCCGRP